MRPRFISKIGKALACLIVITAPLYAQEGEPVDVVEVLTSADDFTTLTAALEAAELVQTLQEDGPFTIFAPTDSAFALLPEGTLEELLKPENKAQLVSILSYHVVPAEAMSADAAGMSEVNTLQGAPLSISADADGVRVNDVAVTVTDIEASNGVIHVIDTVLLPPSSDQTE